MFSDGEEAERQRQPQQGLAHEFDDFIEEDEFSDEERNRQQEDQRRAAPPRRGPSVLSSQYKGLDEDKLQEMFEVFGDGTEYDWALEGEELLDQGYSEEEDEATGPNLKDVFEPGELKDKLLTDEDNAIRVEDVPERYQLLRANFKDEYQLSDEYFAAETEWIVSKLILEKHDYFLPKPYLREPFENAVSKVLEFISRENLEVPFIWTHRKDFLVDDRSPEDLLITLDDLWRIVKLDIEYHGVYLKARSVQKVYDSIGVYDDAYNHNFDSAKTLAEYQDLMDYIQFKYSEIIKDQISQVPTQADSIKRRNRFSRFEKIRKSPVSALVSEYGISAEQVGENILAAARMYYPKDSAETPLDYAASLLERNATDSSLSHYQDAQQIVDDAQAIFTEELFHDPRIRRALRSMFWRNAKVDIVLTDKGRKQIDEGSPYASIKYSMNRSFEELKMRPNDYLRMLLAESEGLVIVRVSYPRYKETLFEHLLATYFASDNTSVVGKAWNDSRRVIFKEVSRKIIPLICNNIKEDLRVECKNSIFYDVRRSFTSRLDQAPFQPLGYSLGTTPRVLTISWGMGDANRDAVLAVVLDEDGEVLEFAKFDNPRDDKFKFQFLDLVNRRVPDVVGIAGFTVPSSKLYNTIKDIIDSEEITAGSDTDSTSKLPLIWVQDEVARHYQNSDRALSEFPDQAKLSLYCVGLARYIQSPLLEYAALEKGILGIRFHDHQDLLSEAELEEAIETVFVDLVNIVGVRINDAVRNPYIANLLPYVAGLGPRKASSMLQGIQSHGGSLTNRTDLVTNEITGKTIFMNCSSFLAIPYDNGSISYEMTEILDATRIHPQDYVIAKKMAADALELDEEDIEAYEGQGGVVAHLINEDTDKLNELILEEFANELAKEFNQKKRQTLEMIKTELQSHFGELRRNFHVLSELEVFTMLTQETAETLKSGIVVPINIRRVSDRFLAGQLSCGVEANVSAVNMFDEGENHPHPSTVFHFGQTVQGVVLDINYTKFTAELSTSDAVIKDAQEKKRRKRDPKNWNIQAEEADKAKAALKKDAQQRATRIIKHPLFKAFNAKQAEEYLATMARGDAVVRPSSLGYDHIAVTWKVTDGIFQHLDVLEIDKPNEFAIGNTLQVGNYRYSDLDELIVMHVQAMARKVEQMVVHDKFLQKTKPEVEEWLKTYTKSNPNRSVYAFCFDHKRAGYFHLMFQTGSTTPIQSWGVKVIPRGYRLVNREFPEVTDLINGFKTMVMNQSGQNPRNDAASVHGGHTSGYGQQGYGHASQHGPSPGGGYNNGYGGGRGYGSQQPIAGGAYRDNRGRFNGDDNRGRYHR